MPFQYLVLYLQNYFQNENCMSEVGTKNYSIDIGYQKCGLIFERVYPLNKK